MRSFIRYFAPFALTALISLMGTGGCSGIGEAIDCDQMCSTLHSCIDSDLDVHTCAERCEDKAENDVLADKLDNCTDCLDHEYACAEIPDRCSMCQEVADAIRER
jgi:hypothetical protein